MDPIEHPDISVVRDKLEACKGHWDLVAAESGVSYSWLSKFANGHVENPGANTLQRVSLACDLLIN
jgi:transcriptional regulator with XRE-family HTH domain